MTAASLLWYWSPEPAGGRHTGEMVDVKKTGDSIVRIAMSLYYGECNIATKVKRQRPFSTRLEFIK